MKTIDMSKQAKVNSLNVVGNTLLKRHRKGAINKDSDIAEPASVCTLQDKEGDFV
jgi:hypothetical protein